MYCNACGKGIAEDARYCTYCGTVIGTTPGPKRLMRLRSDRKIAGVCAGFAEHLDLDVSLVRILWVFITFMAGVFPGVIAYILAWIILPEEPEVHPVVAAGQPVASQ
jgi:phage shock protein C